MIIYVSETEYGFMPHWTEVLKGCQIKLHQAELDGCDTAEPIFLLRNESVAIPDHCKSFDLFDCYAFDDGLAFRNILIALATMEILATPSVRTQFCKIIMKSKHLFNDFSEHCHLFKQLLLSCGFLIDINGKVG